MDVTPVQGLSDWMRWRKRRRRKRREAGKGAQQAGREHLSGHREAPDAADGFEHLDIVV